MYIPRAVGLTSLMRPAARWTDSSMVIPLPPPLPQPVPLPSQAISQRRRWKIKLRRCACERPGRAREYWQRKENSWAEKGPRVRKCGGRGGLRGDHRVVLGNELDVRLRQFVPVVLGVVLWDRTQSVGEIPGNQVGWRRGGAYCRASPWHHRQCPTCGCRLCWRWRRPSPQTPAARAARSCTGQRSTSCVLRLAVGDVEPRGNRRATCAAVWSGVVRTAVTQFPERTFAVSSPLVRR